jgi:hypothetical protein
MSLRLPLLWTLLLLLPFAEWKGIVLPVHGKELTIDWTGRASISPFDLVFVVFSCFMLPSLWDAFRTRRFLSPYLASWGVALVLVIVLYFVLKPSWPFLTPSQVNVIDTRSFIISIAIMVFVALHIASCPIQRIVSGAFTYCLVVAVGLLILSILAFAQLDFFYTHYPFANPQAITFPFPSQNVAATFIVVCLVGILGTATLLNRPWHLALGIPLFVLAVALTGSRSNFAVLVLAFAAFWLAYAFHVRWARHDVQMCTPWLIVPAIAGTVLVVTAGYDWQPIRRSSSILAEAIWDPTGLLGSWRGSPRDQLWSAALLGADISNFRLSRDYGLALVSVEDGCISTVEALSGLKVETQYFVTLRLATNADGARAILEVFGDQERTRLLGTTKIALTAKVRSVRHV